MAIAGKSLNTALDSYALVFSTDGTDAEPTTFPMGITDGDMDLQSNINGGRGNDTKANRITLLITGDQAGTGTIIVTGACEQGPREYIASLEVVIGTTIESGSVVWADSIGYSNYHLSSNGINSRGGFPDGGVPKFGFDAIGYRYLKFYSKDFVTTTNMKIYARYF
jgi:hypothetical protein